jgi:predicted DNA-binding transcriptional regulator AlpA
MATPTPVTDRYMDLPEVAAYTHLSVRTLRRYLTGSTGRWLRSYHVAGKILIRKSELDAWIEQHERRPSASMTRTLDAGCGRLRWNEPLDFVRTYRYVGR